MTMRIANTFAGLEEIVVENVPLAQHTWYRIGGVARWFIRPRNMEELVAAVARCRQEQIKVYILGLGANLVVSDQGVDGAVFRLDHDFFRRIKFTGTQLHAYAGVDMQKLLLRTVRQGLAGIECLAGIPGTLGGGVRMNAGGKFGDIGSVVERVAVLDAEGTMYERTKDELVFEYRSTNITAPVIVSVTLELEQDDPERIMRHTKQIWMYKRNTQPLNTKNCGSIFKNPRGLSAGALIDQAGLKGLSVGGAEVSQKHANFIIAHEGCKADDLLKLIHIIREKVYEKNQILLEMEVQIWQ